MTAYTLSELVFKCRHIGKFISWLRAIEGPTQDENCDIDFGWILLVKMTFISLINRIILRGDVCRGGDFWILGISSYLEFFNFFSC